jgi:hypothetical protein
MQLDRLSPEILGRILDLARRNAQSSAWLRVDMSALAAASDCSTTTLRRYLLGERIGDNAEGRIQRALGLPRCARGVRDHADARVEDDDIASEGQALVQLASDIGRNGAEGAR